MKIILRVLIPFLFVNCYYNNADELIDKGSCVTTDISFSKTILPSLNNDCNNCHSTTNASSLGRNIILDNYTEVLKYVNNGSLIGSIKHSSDFEAMPRGSSKLSDCLISKYETWFKEGAKNN